VKGLVVDWTRLYEAGPPRRISLPTYPFARERYWIPEVGAPAADLCGGWPTQSRSAVVRRDEPATAEYPVGTIQLMPVWNPETEAHLDQARIPRFPSLNDRVAIVGAVAACRDALAQALGAALGATVSAQGRQALSEAHFLDLQPGDSTDD